MSIQFDTYSLTGLQGAVPIRGGVVGTMLRSIENTAYSSFGARNPVTRDESNGQMVLLQSSFYQVCILYKTGAGLSDMLFPIMDTGGPMMFIDWDLTISILPHGIEQVHLPLQAVHPAIALTLSLEGATLSYSVLELNASASTATTTGSTAGTTVTTTNYYEHDYDVALDYNVSYYNDSDFVVRTGFWGPEW